MTQDVTSTIAESESAEHHPESRWIELRHLIEHAAHLLPSQGPITVFVHHNTLHALEEMPFDEALRHGGKIFRSEPYLAEERYREMLKNERIRLSDLMKVLEDDLEEGGDQLIGFMGTRYSLRLAMLQNPLRTAPTHELRWLVAETDALGKFRSETSPAVRRRMMDETQHWVMRDLRNGHSSSAAEPHRVDQSIQELINRFGASTIELWSEATWESFCLHLLWRICLHGVHGLRQHAPAPEPGERHRDLLVEATGEDSDRFVHEPLIRFCAAFLDQGFAHWPLPRRDDGFFASFCALYAVGHPFVEGPLKGLGQEIKRIQNLGIPPLESIHESLELLHVPPSQQLPYIQATLLALPGWGGMIQQMEVRGDRVAHPVPEGTLVEFLAVRLILERIVLANLARETFGFQEPLADLARALHKRIARKEGAGVEQRAFQVFQLAQVLGWLPKELYRLTKREWTHLVEEIEAFSSLERRRVYQLAFERRYRVQTLDAIGGHSRWIERRKAAGLSYGATPVAPNRPKFQLMTCIDDREESLRRHLEEIQPLVETFSVPGFFAVPMYYRGASDAHYVPLCPIVMRPSHWVVEEVSMAFEEEYRRKTQTRKVLGAATHRVHIGSRTFFGGLLTAFVGSLASIPLVFRVLFPRLTAQIRSEAGRFVQPPPVTKLTLSRREGDPAPTEGHFGFTVDEKAASVERLLREAGLTSNFSRLILVVGHGSSSLNNPHESAYNCGACGGARGGPNARSFAQIANEPKIRERLAERGLKLPEDAIFVGAFHNTCDDSFVYFDLHDLPPTHKAEFDEVRKTLIQARERNAQERCRRFHSAQLSLSPEASLRHVEARAEDLSQTRPEFNHATNAVCIVARRSRTRGLFMDRRAFLNSYDPTQDDAESSVLLRILQAAVPVCGGISLEYYFSTVDPIRFGCGTKLPHNITSLLGVMDGAASDLRTGLSTQMTEIHDPIRLLFVIETTPEAILSIMDRNPAIGRLCRNDWVQLAVLDPHSPQIHVFRRGQFERYKPESESLPEVERSSDWFRGWRDNLGYARVCAKESG